MLSENRPMLPVDRIRMCTPGLGRTGVRPVFPVLLAGLLIGGCSDDAAPADEPANAQHAAAFAAAFESGFAPAEATNSQRPPPNSRTGIPFERSYARISATEAMVADNLAENFSFRFLMRDPATFVRSGRVREVYQRDLAARNFPDDTVAGATALMFAVAWELANGRQLSADQNAAMLGQASGSFRNDPLEHQSDEAKQRQADIALTVAGLWLEEASNRAAHPDQMRELADAVHRDMIKLAKIDMRANKVTSDGLAKK